MDAAKGTDSKVSSKFYEVWEQFFKISRKYIETMDKELNEDDIDQQEMFVKYTFRAYWQSGICQGACQVKITPYARLPVQPKCVLDK